MATDTKKGAALLRSMNANTKASVVICAYTEKRWNYIQESVHSCLQQDPPSLEVILVIDHNPQLFQKSQEAFADMPTVSVMENQEQQGLSGARNPGVVTAKGDLIAFLDDDAIAEPDWLGRLVALCAPDDVMGAGARVEPAWETKHARWLPEEFYWVVGCSYRGQPQEIAPVRNPIGAAMVMKREGFDAVGTFKAGVGRVGEIPFGCEETEWCIRVSQKWPQTRFLYDPQAVVYHYVPSARTTWSYFISRCYNEGLSKALLSYLVGTQDSLSSEQEYTLKVLPSGVLRGLRDGFFRLDPSGFGRAFAIVLGLGVTGFGYVTGLMKIKFSRNKAQSLASSTSSDN